MRRVLAGAAGIALTIALPGLAMAAPTASHPPATPKAAQSAPATREAPRSDDLPNPLADKQAAHRARAQEMTLQGQATPSGKNRVVRVGKSQYVELARESEDSIFTVLGEFGTGVATHTHDGQSVTHSGDPGPLHGVEDAGVDVGLDPAEGLDGHRAADGPADPPAGHVEDLGQRAELDRHVQHTVREFSLAVPLEAKSALATTAGSRDLSISGLTDLVAIEAVEYPAGEYPPSYARYSVWLSTLTLLTDRTPGAGEAVNVFWTKLHTMDGSGTTSAALSALLRVARPPLRLDLNIFLSEYADEALVSPLGAPGHVRRRSHHNHLSADTAP